MALDGDGTLVRDLMPINPVIVRGDMSLAEDNVFNRTSGGGFENGEAIYCADQDNSQGWSGYRNGTNDAWIGLLEEVRTSTGRACRLPARVSAADSCSSTSPPLD